MNKIKVIDLLNMISKGEELPEKIKYENIIWILNSINDTYDNGEQCFFEDYIEKKYVITDILNDEVEVIEEKEETKPITKESIEALGYACGEIQKRFINGWNKSLKNEPLIEENKKIKKLNIYHYFTSLGIDNTGRLDENLTDISNKINEIIDKINEMENK